jgi:integrase
VSKGDGWIQKKVRISPTTGKKTTRYIARYTPPGGIEESKSFTREGRSSEPGTAAHWLHQKREEVRTGEYIDPANREWTVGEWADAWLDSYTGIGDDSRAIYRNTIELDIKPSGLGDQPLHAVDRIIMGKWVNSLTENRWWDEHKKPHAPSTAAVRRTITAMIFGAAVEEGILNRNPMRKVRAPQVDVDMEPIDPEELPTMDQVWQLHRIAQDCAPYMAEQIIVTAGTGLRPGELLGVRQTEIRDREIHVVRQRNLKAAGVVYKSPKSRAGRRRVPFGDEVEAAIARHIKTYPCEDGAVIFQNATGEWRRSTWASHWQRIRAKAGLEHMRFYLLRHYYASVLIDGGASPKLVMSRMGHKNSKYTLERYARLWPDTEEVTRELSDSGLKRDKDGTIVPDPNATTAPETEPGDADEEEEI